MDLKNLFMWIFCTIYWRKLAQDLLYRTKFIWVKHSQDVQAQHYSCYTLHSRHWTHKSARMLQHFPTMYNVWLHWWFADNYVLQIFLDTSKNQIIFFRLLTVFLIEPNHLNFHLSISLEKIDFYHCNSGRCLFHYYK